jgi:hypothetical protein
MKGEKEFVRQKTCFTTGRFLACLMYRPCDDWMTFFQLKRILRVSACNLLRRVAAECIQRIGFPASVVPILRRAYGLLRRKANNETSSTKLGAGSGASNVELSTELGKRTLNPLPAKLGL